MTRRKILSWLSLLTVVSSTISIKINEEATTGTKCLRDDTLKDYPVNVYYCDDPTYPTCCQRDFQPECCEDEAEKNLKEQLILWGAVTAVIVIIAIVCLVFWKEDLCCGGEKSCWQKCKENRAAKKYRNKEDMVNDDQIMATEAGVSYVESTGGTGEDLDSGRGSVISSDTTSLSFSSQSKAAGNQQTEL